MSGDVQVAAGEGSKVNMKKSIGLISSCNILIGSMIGSGIFVSPSGIVKGVQSLGASLIIWVACGLYSLLGAYCYAELGTMIHRSGGDYAYVHEVFGGIYSFLRVWIEVLVSRPATNAVISLTFAKYVLDPFFPDCTIPPVMIYLVATWSIMILTFINCLSTKAAKLVQDLFTYAKMIALLVIIISGLVKLGMGATEEFEAPFEGTAGSFGSFVTSFYAGLFAYSGWNYLNCMIEEMKNPRQHLPIAIVFSCLVVTAVYTLANVAYASSVSVGEIIGGSVVAMVFARRMFGWWAWTISIGVSMSCFGGANGNLMSTARIFVVAAQNGHMPALLSMVHMRRLTPLPALVFTSAMTLVYYQMDVNQLLNYLGFVNWGAISVSVFLVIWLRFKRPNDKRPIKVPLIMPIIYVCFTCFLLIFSFQGAPLESLIGVGIVLTGVPVYLSCVSWKNKPKSFVRAVDNFTRGCQKVLEVVQCQANKEAD